GGEFAASDQAQAPARRPSSCRDAGRVLAEYGAYFERAHLRKELFFLETAAAVSFIAAFGTALRRVFGPLLAPSAHAVPRRSSSVQSHRQRQRGTCRPSRLGGGRHFALPCRFFSPHRAREGALRAFPH